MLGRSERRAGRRDRKRSEREGEGELKAEREREELRKGVRGVGGGKEVKSCDIVVRLHCGWSSFFNLWNTFSQEPIGLAVG